MNNHLLITIGFVLFSVQAFAQETQVYSGPIIDMHLHAYTEVPPNIPTAWAMEPEARALHSPVDAQTHMEQGLEAMKRNKIILAVASSDQLKAINNWTKESPNEIIGGIQTDDTGIPIISADSLRLLFQKGDVGILGELGLQYFGVKPDDTRLEPYYDIAEDLGIPVCLHTGLGPPDAPFGLAPKFKTTLGRPSLFEPVMIRYPKLKAFLAHAGWPYINETIAMMYIYSDLYIDLGVVSWALTKESLHNTLKQLIDAGFQKRIMFGSDQMIWPGGVDLAVKNIQEVPFLTEEQKADIFYNNAAVFLGLGDEVIARHHQQISNSQNKNDF